MTTAAVIGTLTPEGVTKNIEEYTEKLIGRRELFDPIATSSGFKALLSTALLKIATQGPFALGGAIATAYEFGYLHGAKDSGHPVHLPENGVAHTHVEHQETQFPDTFSGHETSGHGRG